MMGRQGTSGEAARWALRLRLAVVLLSLLPLVLSVGGFVFIRRAASAQERTLEEFLVTLGTKVAASIPSDEVLWVLPLVCDSATGELLTDRVEAYSDLPAWASLQRTVAGIEEGETVSAAVLLSPGGDPVMSGPRAAAESGQVARTLEGDAPLVRRAALGEIAATPRLPTERSKRVYIPLRMTAKDGVEGRVVGILRLEASRQYFAAVADAQRRSATVLAVTVVLIAVVWYSVYRLVRRAQEAERQAALSDRLRALGTLTAGIAHEIRNPLGIMSLQVEELRAVGRSAGDPAAASEIGGIADGLASEIARLKGLTEQFLGYARPAAESPTAQSVDLAEAVPRMVRLFAKGIAADRIRLVEHFAPGAAHVGMSEPRLGQVLLNLLRNADEAMRGRGGEIRVSTGREGQMAVLVVEDTGPGMAPDVAAQAFDPFFTTRAEGTGLGLPLCRNIVEAAGGRIDLRSAPGAGCRFEVRLPLLP